MATTPATTPTKVTATPSSAASMPGAPVRVMAVALWGVVGTLLGYGILQTVLKAAALFG
ncbi:hypothetical protein [Cellulomonas sp. APG4]|uniref:MFS transporter small subunit n=1 Tax=Cellulomonas sp. APG4 TaxID=1538656 RepID=UPI00192A5C35|nr:hypothetical protein [Cellulomonas sp. APG4]